MLLINEDKKKFKENGYLIKRKVIDPKRVEAALDVIWENIEEIKKWTRENWTAGESFCKLPPRVVVLVRGMGATLDS